jgi:4-amino-4-deoxy-L-arabinose transferase-like glycosyltransferase
MKTSRINYNLLLLCYCVLYIIGLLVFIGLNHAPWTDESHFLTTTELFLRHPTLATLQHYNEMSTPLPFLIYATWAKIGNFDVAWLRILSILIALITYFTYYLVSKRYFNEKIAFTTVIFLSLNPYMFGLSFFVYTDMLSILAIVMAIYFMQRNNIFMVAVCCAMGVLCRQYAVFFTIATGLFYLAEYFKTKEKEQIWNCIKVCISIIVLIPLFILWKGISPANDLKSLYLNEPFQYHINALTAYLVCISIYCLPIITLYIYQRKNHLNLKTMVILAMLSFFYYLFPISTSACGIKAGYMHIGFVDKILHTIIPLDIVIHIINHILFFISLTGLYLLIKESKENQVVRYAMISTGCFLLIMPFSYLTWEKYALPLIAIIIVTMGGETLKRISFFNTEK